MKASTAPSGNNTWQKTDLIASNDKDKESKQQTDDDQNYGMYANKTHKHTIFHQSS